MAVFGWFGTSALLAGLFRLGWGDHSFRAFLKDKYVPAALRFDDPGSYVLLLLVISFAVLMGMALEIPRYVWRGLRSWWAGVTSGLALFTFGFTLGVLVLSAPTAVKLWTIAKYVGLFFLLSFCLFIKARISAERVIPEEKLLVRLIGGAKQGRKCLNPMSQSKHGKKMHSAARRSSTVFA